MPRKARAYTQWTADTEIAFVMALRFHGRARLAAAEIGRTVAGAYLRRNRLPDFAAKWEGALDQWRRANASEARDAAGIDESDPSSNPPHFDGWTPIRRRAFLRVLGETGEIARACADLGLSEGGAYALRRRDPAFAAAWERALAQSAGTLEQVAFERAVMGTEEPVWHAGKLVGTRRRYSDVLLKDLLTAKRKRIAAEAVAAAVAVAKPKPWQRPRPLEEVRDSILQKLSNMARYRRDREAEEAERLLAEGRIP